jgi:hypothetical protein
VHVVVASQTLSNMPAMDRSTLSLLPMRVAFMCNEADADLVMGDSNREVRALSQQGEGIVNAARGEPSHNKPFRGVYVAPDERSALLGALEEKAPDRTPRVFDGDVLAERPPLPAPGSATAPEFALGEPFDLQPRATVKLRRGRGANLALLGGALDDEEYADASVDGAVQSCVADAVAEGLTVHVVDFVGDGEPFGDTLDLYSVCEALGASYTRASGLASVLETVGEELASRREAADYRRAGFLLVLNGLQRALDLVPADSYSDD